VNAPPTPSSTPPESQRGLGATLSEALRRAEARVAETLTRSTGEVSPDELATLVRELGVHQAQLEMQNEELRQAQAELERSRDRYADLYDRAPLGYVTLDSLGHIVEANHVAATLLGVPHPRMLGRPLAQYVGSAHKLELELYLAGLTSGENPGTLELQLSPAGRADGQAGRWVALESSLASAEPHGAPHCRIALVDISERVKMQGRMSRLAAIVASSEDAIVGRDLGGFVDSWNDGARRLFGYSAKEMLGRTMEAMVPDELQVQEVDLLHRLRKGERIAHLESERFARGGVRVPVSMSLWPIQDEHGAVVGSALIARDITERRRADRALRERMRQLDVLSQSGQALILGEQDAPTMRQELLDRVRAAVGNEVCLNYDIGTDGESIELSSSVGLNEEQQAALRSVPMAESLCGLAVRRKSRVVVEHLQHSPMQQACRLQQMGARCYVGCPLIAHGRVFGVAAFVSTTRDRFRRGDLLVIKALCDQVSAMLERSELIAELRRSDQTLRRAVRVKDEMIATLAHELRNPLAPIRNAVGILHRDVLGDPARVAWCRDIIERQVTQMSHLLEDLLDSSRLSRNKIELRLERVELMRAVGQAIEASQPLLDARSQRLQLELPDESIFVDADLTRLIQVFGNLLSNAAKYSNPHSSIALRVWREGETACVSVRDHGIGIAAEQLQQVFGMFSQLSPALERSGGGLGIGLALASGLVEQHRGTLSASSEGLGQGSEFTVRLPIGEPVAPPAAARPGVVRELSRRRVLVVDDNVDSAQTLAAMLTLHDQEVRTAFGGQEALDIAARWQPDVAVLDIGMPGLNGYELCVRLREQCRGHPPLFIACTGWGQEADRDSAHEAGFDFHLVKPIDPGALLRLLDVAPAAAEPGH
jgi:PAS domain S-box-containing protein